MRKLALLALPVAALSLLAAGLAQGRGTAERGRTASTASCAAGLTLGKGKLTIGTDNPAYPPWYGGNPGHGWKVSDPYSGKGYEAAVAYAGATQLGFSRAQVQWGYVPFLKSFARSEERRGGEEG